MVEIHPGLVLLIGAALVVVVGRTAAVVVGIAAAALAVMAALTLDEGTVWNYDYYGIDLVVMRVDALSMPFMIVFAIAALLAMIYGSTTMNRTELAAGLATAGAGIGVVLAGDLVTLFIFWELKVTTVVLLIAARSRAGSAAAAMRYLKTHLVAGVVLLGGIIWLVVRTGSAAFDVVPWSGPGWLILAGFAFAAAAVPLHAWLPDAYPAASVAGAVILSAYTTKSAVYALARGFPGVDLLIWVGVTMAVVGVVFAILEDDIRRLLSYHIVSQVGFMVTAIGVGTAAAINGATAHATAHVIYKALLLMGAGAVLYATGRSRTSELGGLARTLPVVLMLYLVGAFSISGVVGFSGFPAKELAVSSVGAGGETVAQWLLKFASVGTFASVALKLPALTFFGAPRGAGVLRRVPTTMYAAMGAAAIANVAIGVRPRLLFDLLPTAETFSVYTGAKVAESFALLAATTAGVWLLRARLVPKATTSLDTDALYRELPHALGPRIRRIATVATPTQSTESGARPQWWRPTLGALAPERFAPGPVAPGWLLGSTIAGAMVIVLAAIVITSVVVG